MNTNTTQMPTESVSKVSAYVEEYKDYKPTGKLFQKEADTKEELFRSFYNMNRHLRYCNGEFFKFHSKDVEAEYNKWYDSLSKSERFDMYYGDGIVD